MKSQHDLGVVNDQGLALLFLRQLLQSVGWRTPERRWHVDHEVVAVAEKVNLTPVSSQVLKLNRTHQNIMFLTFKTLDLTNKYLLIALRIMEGFVPT